MAAESKKESTQESTQEGTQESTQDTLDRLGVLATRSERTLFQLRNGITLPHYDGTGSFAAFQRSYNDYLNAAQLDFHDGCRLLPAVLSGRPRDAFDKVDRKNLKEGKLNDVMDELAELCVTDEAKMLAQAELHSVYQGSRSVKSFASTLKEAANRAYPGADAEAIRNAVLLTTFINNLNKELQQGVRRSRPKTFEEALATAYHEEALVALDKKESVQSLQHKFEQLTSEVNALKVDGRMEAQQRTGFRPFEGGNRGGPRNFNNSRGRFNQQENRNNGGWTPNVRGFFNRNFGRGRGYQTNNRDGRRPYGAYTPKPRRRFTNRNQTFFNNGNRGFHNQNRDYRMINSVLEPTEEDPMVATVTIPVQEDETDEQREESRRQAKPRKNSLMSLGIFSLVAMCALLGTTTAEGIKEQKAYQCRSPQGGVIVASPERQNCKPPQEKEFWKADVDLYIQKKAMEEVTAWRCSFEIHELCVSRQVWFPYWNQSVVDVQAADADECQEAVNNRTYKGRKLERTGEGVYKTSIENGDWPKDYHIFAEKCERARRLVLERGVVGRLADGTMITTLMVNNKNCTIEDGECKNARHMVLWNPPPKRKDCEYVHLGRFEAIIGNETAMIEAAQAAFILEKEDPPEDVRKCFKTAVKMTKSGTIISLPPQEEEDDAEDDDPEEEEREIIEKLEEAGNETIVEPKGKSKEEKSSSKQKNATKSKSSRRKKRAFVSRIDLIDPLHSKMNESELHYINKDKTTKIIFNEYKNQWKKDKKYSLIKSSETIIGQLIETFGISCEKDVADRIAHYKYENVDQAIMETIRRRELELTLYLEVLNIPLTEMGETLRNFGVTGEDKISSYFLRYLTDHIYANARDTDEVLDELTGEDDKLHTERLKVALDETEVQEKIIQCERIIEATRKRFKERESTEPRRQAYRAPEEALRMFRKYSQRDTSTNPSTTPEIWKRLIRDIDKTERERWNLKEKKPEATTPNSVEATTSIRIATITPIPITTTTPIPTTIATPISTTITTPSPTTITTPIPTTTTTSIPITKPTPIPITTTSSMPVMTTIPTTRLTTQRTTDTTPTNTEAMTKRMITTAKQTSTITTTIATTTKSTGTSTTSRLSTKSETPKTTPTKKSVTQTTAKPSTSTIPTTLTTAKSDQPPSTTTITTTEDIRQKETHILMKMQKSVAERKAKKITGWERVCRWRRAPRKKELEGTQFDPNEQMINELAGSFGEQAHTNYMKEQYDYYANYTRNFTTMSTNLKLQYQDQKIQLRLRKEFQGVYEAVCKARNAQVEIWWALLQINPTIGMRAILGRQDITASYIGERVLSVYQCKEVRIKKVFPDFRVNETCYAYLPVQTETDEIQFLVPGTSDIAESSQTSDCKKIRPYVQEMYNGKYSDNGTITEVTKLRPHESLEEFQFRPISYIAADLFDPAKDSAFPMMLAMETGKAFLTIRERQEQLLRIVTDQERAGSVWGDIVATGGELLGTGLVAAGSFFSGMWDFLKAHMMWVSFGSGGVLVVATIGFIIYRWQMNRTATRMIPGVNAVELQGITSPKSVTKGTKSASLEEPSAPAEEHYIERTMRLYRPPMHFHMSVIILPLICNIANGQRHHLPLIQVSIQDRGLTALWDSGASISYVRETTHGLISHEPLACTNTLSAQVANGSTMNFLGEFVAVVRIGKHRLNHRFLVTRDKHCPAQALLGYDFIAALDKRGISTTIRPEEGIIQIGQEEIKLLKPGDQVYKHTGRFAEFNYLESKQILPKDTADIRVGTTEGSGMMLLKGKKGGPLAFKDFTFHPLESRETTVTLRNKGNIPVNIYEGQSMGLAEEICPITTTPEDEFIAHEYASPEADWEERLPQVPKTSDDFVKEINLDESCLPRKEKNKLREIIIIAKEAFFNENGQFGYLKEGYEHPLDLDPNKTLPRPMSYRIPYGKLPEVERQVEELLRQGVIEKSTSHFTSPVLLTKKKDNTWRFCVDYRSLNQVLKPQCYLLPDTVAILSAAAGAQYLTSMDLHSGFFQIPIREKDRWLTAFAVGSQLYQFKRLPMGLSSAPTGFCNALRILQARVKARLFTYLDDLLIISSSAEQHVLDVKEVLEALIALGLKAKLKKCSFGKSEVKFLGFIVGRQGVQPDPDKVQAITDYPTPATTKGLQSFLGMINYFRKWIRNFSHIAAPLHDLLKSEANLEWKAEHDEAFQKLKSALCTAPILRGPLTNRPFVMETDASTRAVGAVLLQSAADGEDLHPIAYASRKLRGAELNYVPLELEALALTFAAAQFRTYILGSTVTAIVDHRPLTALMTRRDLQGRLAKWQIALMEYNLKIIYRPGRLNSVPDALSRYVGDVQNDARTSADKSDTEKQIKKKERTNVNAITGIDITLEKVREAQAKEKWIQQALSDLTDGKRSARLQGYVKENDILYKCKPDGKPDVIVIPPKSELSRKIIELYHNSVHLAAHQGAQKTAQLIKQRFTWTKMDKEIAQFVRSCLPCQRRKVDSQQTTKEPLEQLELDSSPFYAVCMDILGPLPVTEAENRYILTIRCCFSRWLICRPIKKQDAHTIAKELVESVYLQFEPPTLICTDQGTNFTSDLFQETLKILGTEHHKSAPYAKFSMGRIERAHRTIEELIACYTNKTQSDWDEVLPFITHAINRSVNSSTGYSPYEIIFGYQPKLAEDKEWKTQLPRYTDAEDYCLKLRKHLRELHKQVEKNQEETTKKQNEVFEGRFRVKRRDVKEGDTVLVQRNPPKNKFAPLYQGPYTVTGTRRNNITYKDNKGKSFTAHKNNVKQYIGQETVTLIEESTNPRQRDWGAAELTGGSLILEAGDVPNEGIGLSQ